MGFTGWRHAFHRRGALARGSPVGKALVWRPLCHDRGNKAGDQRAAVKEHVKGVGDEAEAVAENAKEELHKGEGQVEDEEEEDAARLAVLEDAPGDGVAWGVG